MYLLLKIIVPISKYIFILTGIDQFKSSFLIPGGLHDPKKIDCMCSDGKIRSLLLKVM